MLDMSEEISIRLFQLIIQDVAWTSTIENLMDTSDISNILKEKFDYNYKSTDSGLKEIMKEYNFEKKREIIDNWRQAIARSPKYSHIINDPGCSVKIKVRLYNEGKVTEKIEKLTEKKNNMEIYLEYVIRNENGYSFVKKHGQIDMNKITIKKGHVNVEITTDYPNGTNMIMKIKEGAIMEWVSMTCDFNEKKSEKIYKEVEQLKITEKKIKIIMESIEQKKMIVNALDNRSFVTLYGLYKKEDNEMSGEIVKYIEEKKMNKEGCFIICDARKPTESSVEIGGGFTLGKSNELSTDFSIGNSVGTSGGFTVGESNELSTEKKEDVCIYSGLSIDDEIKNQLDKHSYEIVSMTLIDRETMNDVEGVLKWIIDNWEELDKIIDVTEKNKRTCITTFT